MARLPPSSPFAVMVPVVSTLDGYCTKHFDFDGGYSELLSDHLTLSEFRALGEQLRDAVDEACAEAYDSWMKCNHRRRRWCWSIAVVLAVVTLAIAAGVSWYMVFKNKHITWLVAVVVTACTAAATFCCFGAVVAARSALGRTVGCLDFGVSTALDVLKVRLNSEYHSALHRVSYGCNVRHGVTIVARARLVSEPEPEHSGRSKASVVPAPLAYDAESAEQVDDSDLRARLEWVEFQLPRKTRALMTSTSSASVVSVGSTANVPPSTSSGTTEPEPLFVEATADDVSALHEVARLLAFDDVEAAERLLSQLLVPPLDARVDGAVPHSLRLVAVALTAHCYARHAPLFRGKTFERYPCTALLREASQRPYLIPPALRFLDSVVPPESPPSSPSDGLGSPNSASTMSTVAAVSGGVAVLCYIKAFITFNAGAVYRGPGLFDFDGALALYTRAATGYVYALPVIAMYNANGWGSVTKDLEEAGNIWEQLVCGPRRVMSAVRWYGNWLLSGKDGRSDLFGGLGLVEEAAAWGDPLAITDAGEYALSKKDFDKAAVSFKVAAATGFARAQSFLARMMERGQGGLEPDEAAWMRLYQLAAEQDDAYAKRRIVRGRRCSSRGDVDAGDEDDDGENISASRHGSGVIDVRRGGSAGDVRRSRGKSRG